MKQELFIARHEPEWVAFERWLDQQGGRRLWRRANRPPLSPQADALHGPVPPLQDQDMPSHYRRLCHQAALAHRRGYSPLVTARLQVLMQRGHDVLYRAPPTLWRGAGRFVLADFPRLVRAQRGWLWLATVLFAGSMLAMFTLVKHWPELAYAVLSPEQLAEFEHMYAPDSALADGRGSAGNLNMFGFYIFNNISIGFRTFASGLLAGIGSMLVLVFNGMHFGVIAAHVQGLGHGPQFWPFVAGHSAPELIAIVIAGAAGLQLGVALVAPGRLGRMDALRRAGLAGAVLCAGVLVMLLLAAFIEAFWSAQPQVPALVKFVVGALLWLLVLVWLGFGGRAHGGFKDAP